MQYYYRFHIKESVLSTPPEMHRIIPAGGGTASRRDRERGILIDQNIGEGGSATDPRQSNPDGVPFAGLLPGIKPGPVGMSGTQGIPDLPCGYLRRCG